MLNCLKKAGALIVMPAQPRPQPQLPPLAQPRDQVVFMCVGPTALTVTGPATGRRYRFERPGALLAVDARDRSALAAVLYLRLQPSMEPGAFARQAA